MEIKTYKDITGHKCIRSGQYHAYGDTFREFEVYTENGKEIPKEDLLDYCFSVISKRKVQSEREWRENHGDMGKYFSGYYTLGKREYGYKYVVCEPYTD